MFKHVKKIEHLLRLHKKKEESPTNTNQNLFEAFKDKCSKIPIQITGQEQLLIKDPEEERRKKEEKQKSRCP